MKSKRNELKPFTLSLIQVCPVCGKVDAYLGDNHDCQEELKKQEDRMISD
jgi:hypothetical protein